MNISDQLARTFNAIRPSQGPGFEQRAVAGALARVHRRRQRRAIAAVTLGCAALAGAALLLLVTVPDRLQSVTPELPTTADSTSADDEVVADDDTAIEADPGPAGRVDSAIVEASQGPLPDDRTIARIPGLGSADRLAIEQAVDRARKVELTTTAAIDAQNIDLRRELARGKPRDKVVAHHYMQIAVLEGRQRSARAQAWLVLRAQLTPTQLAALIQPPRRKTKKPAHRCDEVTCLVEPSLACCKRYREGSVLVSSKPVSFAYVDGKAWGDTPFVKLLSVGTHTVVLKAKAGGQLHKARVRVRHNKQTRLHHDFTKPKPKPRKTNNVDPWANDSATPDFMGSSRKHRKERDPTSEFMR